jgi:hypothetical protein
MAVALWMRDDVHGETEELARALYIRFEKDLDITRNCSLTTPAFAAGDLLPKTRPCFEHSALLLSRCFRYRLLRSRTTLRAAGTKQPGQHAPDCNQGGTVSLDTTKAHSGSNSMKVVGAGGYCGHAFFGTTKVPSGDVYVRTWL